MNVFRDLFISADVERMSAAVAEMEKALPAGWKRDKAAEARSRAAPTLTKRVSYCFSSEKAQERPAAMLILAQKDMDRFYVSNIIPLERHQLERAEYNRVLEDFYERVVRPYAEKAKMEHELTRAEVGLEQWMDPTTAERLRAFSACANKGTGASHPNDRERWKAFLLSAHQTDCNMDPSTLARWLVEVEGWSPETAEQLALEYESGRDLLAYANH